MVSINLFLEENDQLHNLIIDMLDLSLQKRKNVTEAENIITSYAIVIAFKQL